MYTCRFARTIEEPWTAVEPISLGTVPSGRGTPESYCLVEQQESQVMRFDVYGEDRAFADAQIWKTWVVIGFADAVHFVALDTKQRYSYPLRGYFDHLYPTEAFLLVASASELLCFDPEIRLQWRAEDLGIDGVVIKSVENDMIRGEGEWDPPGGWRPFTVSLRSGRIIAE
ncbi:hypothetical protein [Ktedonobacter robiniae]|uniref:ATP-dependent DNA ligase family profile domain-containing protein n=1 Tax=Ktedonobacter robiniae TaxID=2778365 RepID=A0ABQ3UTB2_9CHLR|nr:hypothetical protein [Ktedonobacter robiniae]GHO55921.1 hypothetical protein KSB_43960 [Ktedonobacter robiniae]